MLSSLALFVVHFVRGFFIALLRFAALLVVANTAFGAAPAQRVQEATIGQQDRSLHVDPVPYDNSAFLQDMDAIASGTYNAPLEPQDSDTADGAESADSGEEN